MVGQIKKFIASPRGDAIGCSSDVALIGEGLVSMTQQHKYRTDVGREMDHNANDILRIANLTLGKARPPSSTEVWLSNGCLHSPATNNSSSIWSKDVHLEKGQEQVLQINRNKNEETTAGCGTVTNGSQRCPDVSGREPGAGGSEVEPRSHTSQSRSQGNVTESRVILGPIIAEEAGEAKVLRELPSELLQLCLARVPYKFHPRLKAVCRQWRNLADGHRLLQIRREAGKTEVWTFILENEYDYYRKYLGLRGHAYSLYNGAGSTPPPQLPYGHIMWDGDRPYVAPFQGGHPIGRLQTPLRLEYGATGGGGLLYVLGGRPALNGWHTGFSRPASWEVFARVDVYDAATNAWSAAAPMPLPRYAFATGAVRDLATNQVKVVVAGGFATDESPLNSADIYDPATDSWQALPPMLTLKGSCRGQVVDGRFMVKQMDGGHFIEAFDYGTRSWTILLEHGQVEINPLNIGDMNNNRSRNFTSVDL